MHDHRVGLQRGIPGPMAGAATEADKEGDTQTKDPTPDHKQEPVTEKQDTTGPSINAASMGGKKSDKGQRKGYGQ